ncbi:Hypothetical predicted protein, partial [Paramuricea clavata]
LRMNYKIDSQSFTTASEILHHYQINCPEKENFCLNIAELGIIFNEVFPDAKKVQKRVNGKRVYQYTITKQMILEQTDNEFLEWDDLPSFTAELGWQLSDHSDDFFEWVKIPSQDLCNGHRVVLEVKIYKD